MMNSLKQATLAVALTTLFTFQSHAYTITGNHSNLSPTLGNTYTWDSSQFTTLRAALEDENNFGANGTVSVAIDTVDMPVLNPTALQGVDAFVSSWWAETDSSAYGQMIVDAFLNGMDLVLLQDHISVDGIGTLLGVPTNPGTTMSTQTPSSPLSDGPFGSVSSLSSPFFTGHLSTTDITSNNGNVCMTNAAGEAMAGCWARGEYAAGAGALVILFDTDSITSFGGASYDPLNDRGRFSLNVFSFLAQGGASAAAASVSEPGALLLLGVGLMGVTLRRRASAS